MTSTSSTTGTADAAPSEAATQAGPDPSTPPAGGALAQHIKFFDVNGDGRVTADEIHQCMLEMGFSKLTAAVVAPALALVLPSKVDDLLRFRHADSATFSKDGSFDDAAFERWFSAADDDGSGGLTRFELMKSSLALADGPLAFFASTAEFQLMYTIVARDGQAPKDGLRDFFSGAFIDKILARREAAAAAQAAAATPAPR